MHAIWVSPDGRRSLRYFHESCLGDNHYGAVLRDLPSQAVLFERESGKLGVLPGRSGGCFYLLEWGRLSVHAIETGGLISTLAGPFSSFAPDAGDTLLVAVSDQGIVVAEVQSARILHRLPGGLAAFSPDGSLLASIDEQHRTLVYRVADGQALWQSPPFPRALYPFFTSDGCRLVIEEFWTKKIDGAYRDCTVHRFYNTRTFQEEAHPGTLPPPWCRGITMWGHPWPPVSEGAGAPGRHRLPH
jgi:hypothetical protein